MGNVIAEFMWGNEICKLELVTGEPLYHWDTPYQVISGGVTYSYYQSAFYIKDGYLYYLIGSTVSSGIKLYFYRNGSWVDYGVKAYNERKKNNIYYPASIQIVEWYGVNLPVSSVMLSGFSYSNWNSEAPIFTISDSSSALALKNHIESPYSPPVVYNWQSVPFISGKNGILSLVTLDSESINDGEPVSGAAVSVFDQVPSNDNNIKNLADTYGGGEASSAVDVTAKYKVTLPPGGSFSVLKLVAKKDSMPNDASDGDKIVDISPSKTKKTVTGLDENSLYYFKIFAEDTNSNTSESDEKHIMTSGDEGWSFDYTGSIQTFVAPKTGIYQLESWGAQGGDATDGTLTARGGYGAYAVGEVFLTQGDTLYINVGGQDGYGGGGNPVTNIINVIENNTYNPDATPQGIDITNNVATYAISSGSGSWTLVNSQLSEYLLTNKTLICYMSGNIRYALTSDGIFRRSSNRPSMAAHTFIPVNRQINLQKLHFKHKDYSRYGDYFQGTVGIGYVEDGVFKMGATMDLDLRSTTVSDWASKEIDISSVPYVDYIYIVWYDGCEDFKDFEIEYI